MDDEAIKKAILGVLERGIDAHDLSEVVRMYARGPRPTYGSITHGSVPAPTAGAQRVLTRIVLGDILDDAILSARPQDRTFPLRLFFGELSRLLATESDDPKAASISDGAFVLASGLNFFFRASMSAEAKMRVGIEVSRQLYGVAHAAELDRDMVTKAAPLLATLMTNELERLKFESVDHTRVFDGQIHERTPSSDPTAHNIVRPASFLCRVTANGTVKIKAEVVT